MERRGFSQWRQLDWCFLESRSSDGFYGGSKVDPHTCSCTIQTPDRTSTLGSGAARSLRRSLVKGSKTVPECTQGWIYVKQCKKSALLKLNSPHIFLPVCFPSSSSSSMERHWSRRSDNNRVLFRPRKKPRRLVLLTAANVAGRLPACGILKKSSFNLSFSDSISNSAELPWTNRPDVEDEWSGFSK